MTGHPWKGLLTSAILAALLELAGCADNQPTRFYTLSAMTDAPGGKPPATRADLTVGIGPVTLPPYLDRPQLVTWTAPGELKVDEFVRWGEPLDTGVTRTTVENLAALLPQDRVVRAPWPAARALRCRVAIDCAVSTVRRGSRRAVRLARPLAGTLADALAGADEPPPPAVSDDADGNLNPAQ